VQLHGAFHAQPVVFFDLNDSFEKKSGTSYANHSEVLFIVHLLNHLCYSHVKQHGASNANSALQLLKIAVITPYKSQVNALKQEILSPNLSRNKNSSTTQNNHYFASFNLDIEINR
jgi:hypothetical protein